MSESLPKKAPPALPATPPVDQGALLTQTDRNVPAQRASSGGVALASYHQQPGAPPAVPAEEVELSQPKTLPPPGEVLPDAAENRPGRFNLRQLSDIALQINPILERSMSDIEAAKGERVQASLYPNPTFETNNPEIFAGQNSSVNFGFQQDILVKGKMRAAKAAADQLVRRETADFHLDRNRMLMNIRGQYYQVVAAKQRAVLSAYIIKVAQQGVEAAKQLQLGGEGSLTDVLLLENELQRALIESDKAKTMLQGEIRQLQALVGAPDLVIADVEGSLFDQPPDFDESAVSNFATTQSAYIERGLAEIVRSEAQLRREEVEAYPNLRMGPAYQAGTQSHTGQFWLSILFDIPIFDLNQGNIRKAQAQVRTAAADLQITRNELLQHTAEIYARYRSAKQTADRLRNTMLPNSQKTLQLVQEGFSKGQFDVNRLLQAQRNLSDIAKEHIEAAEKAWTTSAELGALLQMEDFGR
ncbi:MAG: TolC family protein [Planctomycetales bacterium]|nr:TolC family protein [Planctomycetales bacterium]